MGGAWILTFGPARHFFGISGIEAVSVSAASCLLPGWLTFWCASRFKQPRMQALSVLFGTALRVFFALVGVVVMQFLLGLPYENYLIWLGIFYLVALAVETALMIESPRNAKAG